jgi:Mlc titration factor MtfA (ptsG expression regulator)
VIRWLKRRLRGHRPFPPPWQGVLAERVAFYPDLEAAAKKRLHHHIQTFIWEKHFIGANGFEITDEVKVVIAAAAARLVLHLDFSVYNSLTEIIVYHSTYKHPDEDHAVFGEAHTWGTVVLSWDAVVQGLANPDDGHDTATHEFAHVLDYYGDREFNGTPELRARDHYRPWAMVMSTRFRALEKGRSPERKVLRRYGATNEAEFFAVATESFFEKPEQMKKHTPDLYDELCQFYGLDPAQRN